MEWHELYTQDVQPSPDEIADYIGKAKGLWLSLTGYIEETYKVKPKTTYSGCCGKPGWNVKYQKSGVAFGTLYPQKDCFDIMIITGYKIDHLVEAVIDRFTPETAEQYRNANDYMKIGKYMMMRIDSPEKMEDYKTIIAVKMSAKIMK